ncbi:hypothetical protein IFM89_006063 [Coptis chinensis]|uniref:Exostosin GT47 domain-containing protein n=1 Tax=Coptis chinensis TaxID=261450 RepID=A0A835H4V4_9MAGN|nr:hypothetical protein IFM89_006063 [Coptis chinensis]
MLNTIVDFFLVKLVILLKFLDQGKPEELTGSVNESSFIPRRRRVHIRSSKLGKLELGLARARTAIREVARNGNQTTDHYYMPQGPIYKNPSAFQRSYLEMEKQFKVFIYEEGEPPLFHNGPCKSIYSMEGNFIHELEINPQYRTRDPEKAHVFFLPFSVAMMVQFIYVSNSHDTNPIRQTISDYVNVIAKKYPYWNRSLGADHFMLSCHDWGPLASSFVPSLSSNSIRVLCNANTSEGFKPSKDVSFPEINLKTGDAKGRIGGPPPSRRPIIAFFAGGLHGPIRPILLKHWKKVDEDIQVYEYLPKGMLYYDMMQKSKYCICPSGYEVASPRIVEAIYTGCVPVLISDHYVSPFSDVLNWKSFSVVISSQEIPNLKRILMAISPRKYIRMQRRVVQVRRHFEVNSPSKRFDVFSMILHSIWLRRLNIQIHDQLFKRGIELGS